MDLCDKNLLRILIRSKPAKGFVGKFIMPFFGVPGGTELLIKARSGGIPIQHKEVDPFKTSC